MYNIKFVKRCFKIYFFIFLTSCTNDLSTFFEHKSEMEKLYGPCNWKYVGIDTIIKNPAIKIIPQNGVEYVLWNQECNI